MNSPAKSGLQVYYSLRVPCILNFFGGVESVIKDSATTNLQLLTRR